MNKYKKIATAVASIVLAGTMVGSFAACGGNKGDNGNKLEPKTDENGNLTYAAGTSISLNIGNQNNSTPAYTTFKSTYDLSGATYLVDGKQYAADALKPAWQAVSDKLGVNLKDNFENLSSDAQIETPIKNNNLSKYDIISGSLSAINQNSGSNTFVDLSKFLQYMPNYRAFLEANPAAMYSLTGDATGAMYAAPYFDGNNDIENYALIRKDWVSNLLDGDFADTTFKTFAAQALAKDTISGSSNRHNSIVGETTSITSYMGTTGGYNVEVVNADGTTGWIRLDYTAALNEAKGSGALAAAITEAAGTAYTGESGNIVDIQNFVINTTNGNVTGDKLAKIVSEYIKVAYLKVDSETATTGTPFYTTPSDVFNSVSAAWDVDLLAATLRCMVTAVFPETQVSSGPESTVWGLAARQSTTQRRVNLYALAGELYGVRGMESRLEYLYVDNNGDLQDARENAESYELLSRLSAFAKEGILYTGSRGKDGENSYVSGAGDSSLLAAMSYDYVQTQTRGEILGRTPPGYNYAPIVTPVSKWDVDGDGNHTDIMRFTESWRSVKNTGFCIPTVSVAGNPDKLSAILTLIDYMFSEDGQMLLTYGTPSSTDSYQETGKGTGTSSDNGWWYAKEAEGVTLADVIDSTKTIEGYGKVPTQYKVNDTYKTKVFVYEGKVYEGVEYGGRVVPKITKANRALFEGAEITVEAKDGGTGGTVKQAAGNIKIGQVGNYTNYARLILGTTMPVGNKNQGFEYQCTAECGKAGASIVDQAIQANVIKHVYTNPEEAPSAWYFISPTVFPLTQGNRSTLTTDAAQTLLGGTYFVSSSSTYNNVYIDLIYYGLGSTSFLGAPTNIAGNSNAGTLKTSGAEYITFLTSGNLNNALTARVNIYQIAWNTLKTLYKIEF